tara:strand:+ start:179 stop:379 length:201 start_codon:yes stop_codon:yes gene_type:complete
MKTTDKDKAKQLINKNKNKMKKDIKFYKECLRRELNKPFYKQDFMYMRHLDQLINQLKLNKNENNK